MTKPVVKQLETEKMVLNFGPQHPSTHGTLRIIMELNGETVVKAIPEIGYLHSGFEKLGEDLDFNQYVTITDRMNYLSPLCNNVAYSLAAEKLIGIEVSKRTEYIRVLMSELSRIADHILNIGMLAVDLGALTSFLYGFRLREDIYDLFEIAPRPIPHRVGPGLHVVSPQRSDAAVIGSGSALEADGDQQRVHATVGQLIDGEFDVVLATTPVSHGSVMRTFTVVVIMTVACLFYRCHSGLLYGSGCSFRFRLNASGQEHHRSDANRRQDRSVRSSH